MSNNPIELYRSLVMLDGDESRTTSNTIAARFNRHHKSVLTSIDRLICSAESHGIEVCREMFLPIQVLDSRGKTRRAFSINKDGFMMLAMRFDGPDALQWQFRFVEAFNWLIKQMQDREENNRLMAQFDIKNRASIADGSYHGAGLQRRKVEKIVLGIEERIIKAKVQQSISFGENANEADASALPN